MKQPKLSTLKRELAEWKRTAQETEKKRGDLRHENNLLLTRISGQDADNLTLKATIDTQKQLLKLLRAQRAALLAYVVLTDNYP